MSAEYLVPMPGPAADFAGGLRAQLPVLRTPRTILRAPLLEDAPAWSAILEADAEGHMGGPFSAADAFAEFAATIGMWLLRGHGLWTVIDHQDTVLGFVLIGYEPGDPAPELGFMFCETARGQGYAREAAEAVLRHARETLRLPALVSCIAPGNAPSRRLAERLGARLEGILADEGDAQAAEIWRHLPEAVA